MTAVTVPTVLAPPLLRRYREARARSVALAAPLSDEDMGAQSMPDASPVKWHLAHTTWFWETFVLEPNTGAAPFDPAFRVLFNSYYEGVGPRPRRDQRGLMTRPPAARVLAYRAHVDAAMAHLLSGPLSPDLEALVVLGLAHEEQHQELILSDVLHLLAQNPLRPVYAPETAPLSADAGPVRWASFDEGATQIGAQGGGAFAFDNEGPRHTVWLHPFRIADRLATNAEYAAFIEAGGYRAAALWLSEGWALAQVEGWTAPFYWEPDGEGGWREFGLNGLQPINPRAPVRHVSYYEADAFARWRGLRLPTEAEWEHAAASGMLRQAHDRAWQWTSSAYAPYPGFHPPPGAVGEYNGKFMVNQMVLRGGAAETPPGHARATYRNFYHPHQRWCFAGVRLAADRPADPRRQFEIDALEGLSAPAKSLPSKWLYDEAGSALFEAITELPEYYPTRTETALLERVAAEVVQQFPTGSVMVEFGSGSSRKTRILLDAADKLAAYAPIDISIDALAPAAAAIAEAHQGLKVVPVEGDFTAAITLPSTLDGLPRVGFFPGSTIGNFPPAEAAAFLRRARTMLGEGALFLVGVDVVKAEDVLVAAYDDAQGVTARFDLNLLTRINRELGGDFDLTRFRHRAVWNAVESRMEMRIESLADQTAHVSGRPLRFKAGETVHTESSYKYAAEGFEALAASAGWSAVERWVAPEPYAFALILLRAAGG